MTPYLDGGFLLTLLILTDGTYVARDTLKNFGPPWRINRLHQLQVENLLQQLDRSNESERRLSGETGKRLWAYYFSEGILIHEDVEWESALKLAIGWNLTLKGVPPPPLLLLHPAAGVVTGATHFLSFDPRSRAVAQAAKLKLLPAKL